MSRHHTIDYVELAAADVAASQKFYTDVFGWEFNSYGPMYAGIRAPGGEGEVGGLSVDAVAGSGTPLVILYSEDLDATLAAVRAAGASADEPYPFPGGRRFHFTDPGGNELAVWSAT